MRTLLVVLLLLGAVGCDSADEQATSRRLPVTSASFNDGEDIPVQHTCDGQDVPPPLTWEAPPSDAAELIVVVDDPDAPGSTFVHWLVAGLPPEEATLDDPLPTGAVEGRNDFDDVRWSGPCPPRGDDPHTYRFRVLAVAEETGLDQGFTAEDLEGAIADRLLAEGVHTGRYGR